MIKHILLTISILISDRPDTVRKCLDSVQPLLKAVPSELILTDTGCGEQVRSIIEEYTDHIIRFKWCNDFAKARNVGLKQAKGKWFLFLDDDEWFEDTTEIIEFFNSGEYKQYGIGAYSQRNYGNREGTIYSDLLVGRMTRLEPDVKFEYSIHESFNRVVGKVKKFNVFVHHYGYVYDTKEALHAHARRNIEPLLKELKAAPNDMKVALQLTQEYNVIEDYEKSVEVSREAIEIAKKGPIKNDFCLASIYTNVVLGLMDLWRFQEGLAAGEEYMQLDAVDPMAKSLIAVRMTAAYMRDKEYEKCFALVQYYWDVYQDYVKDDEKFITYITNITCATFEPYNRSIILGNGVNAAIFMGKEETAWKWFQEMEIDRHVVYIEPEMVKAVAEKLPEASEAVREYYTGMCNMFLKREDMKYFITDIIIARCRQGETWEDKIHLMSTYRDCVFEHPFGKMVQLAVAVCDHSIAAGYGQPEETVGQSDGESEGPLGQSDGESEGTVGQLAQANGSLKQAGNQSEQFGNQPQIEQLVEWFWEHMSVHMRLMKDFDLMKMEEHLGIAPGEILEKIPYYAWQRELTAYFGQYDQEDAAWWTEKFSAYLAENSMRLLLWNAFVGIYDAIKEADAEGTSSMELILSNIRKYAGNRIALCEQIYRPEILQSRRDVLAEEDQAAYQLMALEKQINAGDYADAIKEVKELRTLLPGLNPVMKYYLEWLSDKMKEQEQEKKKAANEFQVLSVGVKLKIRQLMTAGNYEAALAVAQQLSNLMPEDEELLRQIDKLKGMLQDE